MNRLIEFSIIYIVLALYFIGMVKEIGQSHKSAWNKVILLSILNFINYCIFLYCYSFVSWINKFHKFYRYPFRTPFCGFVLIGSIVLFIIAGVLYIKQHKYIYGEIETTLYFLATHIIPIIFLILLRVPYLLGL